MAPKILPLPPQAELRRLFDYDPLTGVLKWRVKASRKHLPGMRAGTQHRDGGWQVRINGVIYQVHRIIWKWMTDEEPVEVDHANLCRWDNAWLNLRDATRSQNGANQGLRDCNSAGFKGTYLNKSGKYVAQTKVNGEHVYLGVHDTAEAAHAAYCFYTQAVFGEFHRGS